MTARSNAAHFASKSPSWRANSRSRAKWGEKLSPRCAATSQRCG
jgi:hypothetical protein